MLTMSYMGDHVWFMTSRQTEPDLCMEFNEVCVIRGRGLLTSHRCWDGIYD